ncbi:hypothetical protein KQI49_01375 [Virgibacillus sp. MSJ-26]|uniref:DnaA N-terminal domain-containing protein n=1 Tax=Virgibacillus sp. MSJ-26 TaxID=2841522 RepID=UPI001C12324B|nr:DnaA N-terminal domain-containing protein [Virgibacillus sp. MSJ-26]MBU5465477.1 hypothetical protein [Virgibacillus sp. MSJ-26]
MEAKQLWSDVLQSLKEQLSAPSYDTWLKDTEAHDVENGVFTVTAANEFQRDWLRERYSTLIEDTLKDLTGEEWTVSFIVKDRLDSRYSQYQNNERSHSLTMTDLLSKIKSLEARVQDLEARINDDH